MLTSNGEKPSILIRLGLIFALAAFLALEQNPLVRLQAILGLSPAPLERLLGIKNLFSGMTEGVHRLALLDFRGSVSANVFAPAALFIVTAAILTWKVPKIHSRANEVAFFTIFLVLSILVNIFHS